MWQVDNGFNKCSITESGGRRRGSYKPEAFIHGDRNGIHYRCKWQRSFLCESDLQHNGIRDGSTRYVDHNYHRERSWQRTVSSLFHVSRINNDAKTFPLHLYNINDNVQPFNFRPFLYFFIEILLKTFCKKIF